MMGAMARNRAAYNCTDSPIVVDGDGHTIGGREHGKVDVDEQLAADAIARGVLLLREDVLDPAPPELVPDPVVELVDAEPAPAPAPRSRRQKETS